MSISGAASGSTSFFSSWPSALAIHSPLSRTKAIRLFCDQDKEVAFGRNNCSLPVSVSTEKVLAPRVNVRCLASGIHAGKDADSSVCESFLRSPVGRFKTQSCPSAITATRLLSGVIATSVSTPSISANLFRRGTSKMRWVDRVAVNRYQTAASRVAATTKGMIGKRIKAQHVTKLVLAHLRNLPIIRDGLFDKPAKTGAKTDPSSSVLQAVIRLFVCEWQGAQVWGRACKPQGGSIWQLAPSRQRKS